MRVFDVLNLEFDGLEKVKSFYEIGDFDNAKKELKKYFCSRSSTEGFIDDEEKIVSYAKRNLSEDINSTISMAEEIYKREFRFTLPWDMERCYDTVKFNGEINWSLNPYEDEEWTFMLSRHRFLNSLTEGYLYTGNRKYLEDMSYLINDWIDKNRDIESLNNITWRTIEAGIRIKNWVKSLEVLFKHSEIEEELLCKILVSISDHLVYLHENNKYERILSNWVILEQQGAFIAEVFFPELKVSKLYKEKSLQTLEEAINLQVVEDGLHWEQSFQYHNEMLRCFLEIIIISERNNIQVSARIKKKVKDMLYATLYTIKPNHCQSNYGDSDEEDLRELMNLGAIIFKDSILKNYGNERIDINTLLTFGYSGVGIFDSLEKNEVLDSSKAFEDTGIYFMRTGFKEYDSYSMFKCGFLGSGHGHADTLHLEITYKGEDVLVDSGRFTYSPYKKERIQLKKPMSHNTNIVNNTDFTICTSSWGNNGVATPLKGKYKFKENYDFVEGGHLGYINSVNPTVVNRKVIFIKPDIWIISDEFFANEKNMYSQFYNFNKPKVEKIDRNKLKYCGDKIDFYIENQSDEGEFILENNFISKNYNQGYESTRAIFNLNSKGNSFINTVMYGVNKGEDYKVEIKYVDVFDWKGKKIGRDIVEGISVNIKNRKYIILLVHREDPKGRKLYIVNGYRVYGRVAVIKEENNSVEVEVMAY